MDAANVLERHCVTVSGNPDAGRAIVFVHGFGTDQTAWQAVAAAFASDFRTVTYDQAGAGRAAHGTYSAYRYLSLKAYAEDLEAIGDALGLRDAIAVGHSVGGIVALLAANDRPDLFAKLVLVCASPRYLDEPGYHGGFTQADLQELYSRMMNSYPDWAHDYASRVLGCPERPHLAERFASCLKAVPPDRALSVLCAILQSDHREDLARVDRPVLLIQSQDDLAVPADVAVYMNGRIRGSTLTFIPATGHLPHLSEPQQVVAAIGDFLR